MWTCVDFAWWNAERVSALGSVIGAVGSAGALIIAIILISKQSASLATTTQALKDEMAWRREERERLRAAQASNISFDGGSPVPDPDRQGPKSFPSLSLDTEVRDVIGYLESLNNSTTPDLLVRFQLLNASDGRITNVSGNHDSGRPALCRASSRDEGIQSGNVPLMAPDDTARFYWVKPLDDLGCYIDFTDESGIRWRLHHRDGLRELTEKN